MSHEKNLPLSLRGQNPYLTEVLVHQQTRQKIAQLKRRYARLVSKKREVVKRTRARDNSMSKDTSYAQPTLPAQQKVLPTSVPLKKSLAKRNTGRPPRAPTTRPASSEPTSGQVVDYTTICRNRRAVNRRMQAVITKYNERHTTPEMRAKQEEIDNHVWKLLKGDQYIKDFFWGDSSSKTDERDSIAPSSSPR